MTRKLLVGSNNLKKRKEIGKILHNCDFEIVTPQELAILEEPEESGATFMENAEIKALYYAGESGLLTLADDSGLSVDALGGAPGVRSSRYAAENATDDENCSKLLEALAAVADPDRTARFQCAVVVAEPGVVLARAQGRCEGLILRQRAGESGFGYDPLFLYPPEGITFAQLGPEIKNRVSHRGQALEKIHGFLEKL
jgi:XTP/dITP diphosphohydrolase